MDNVEFSDISSSSFDFLPNIDEWRTLSGSAIVDVLDDGSATYSSCSGLLVTLCSGNMPAQFSGDTGVSFGSPSAPSLSQLSPAGFAYTDDARYSFGFDGATYMTVGFQLDANVSSLNVTAVPLPASLPLLLGVVAAGFGVSRLRKRRQA